MRWSALFGVAVFAAGCAHPTNPGRQSAFAAAIPDRVIPEFATAGNAQSRLSHAPASLVLFHIAEQRGSLDTCGCPRRPRGSLGRFAGWIDASQAAAPAPAIVVNTGYWLVDSVDYAGQVRPDAAEMNGWMARGLELTGFDAVNVSGHDALGLAALSADHHLPLVSANVSGPGIARWVTVDRGGIKVGITGVTSVVATMGPEGENRVAPVASAAAVLRDLVSQVDVVVLLAWNIDEELPSLLREAPGVDVVVGAGLYTEGPPGHTAYGSAWTSSVFQGVQAGELRMTVRDGKVLGALDRRIDLDDAIAPRPAVDALMGEAKRAIDAVQKAAYGG